LRQPSFGRYYENLRFAANSPLEPVSRHLTDCALLRKPTPWRAWANSLANRRKRAVRVTCDDPRRHGAACTLDTSMSQTDYPDSQPDEKGSTQWRAKLKL
jgi:hypothetical protein